MLYIEKVMEWMNYILENVACASCVWVLEIIVVCEIDLLVMVITSRPYSYDKSTSFALIVVIN